MIVRLRMSRRTKGERGEDPIAKGWLRVVHLMMVRLQGYVNFSDRKFMSRQFSPQRHAVVASLDGELRSIRQSFSLFLAPLKPVSDTCHQNVNLNIPIWDIRYAAFVTSHAIHITVDQIENVTNVFDQVAVYNLHLPANH
jgi:hypothetical protein